MWKKLGGRKFVGWGFVGIIWALSVILAFANADKKEVWMFTMAFTPEFLVLTGYYINQNIKLKQNGGG